MDKQKIIHSVEYFLTQKIAGGSLLKIEPITKKCIKISRDKIFRKQSSTVQILVSLGPITRSWSGNVPYLHIITEG